MPPPQAGAVLHDLKGPKTSRIPFIVFLALICFCPLYFAPHFWLIGLGAFVLFTAFYWFGENASARRRRLDFVCENGLVVSERGADTVIPWKDVQSVSAWSHRTTTGYDVNARDTRYRLDSGSTKKLRPVIDTVVAKAPLEWIHENIAVRPENAPKARETLDKILATIGR
ncbi:MAG: hypothetical protein ACAI38_23010 [Myxococcota bacterium]|nr:hypothetical protein [Myxococcota bacterium]